MGMATYNLWRTSELSFKASTLSSSLIFKLVEMLPIDRYNLSDAFYHKISLNVLKKTRYIKVKKRYFLSWLITQVSYS